MKKSTENLHRELENVNESLRRLTDRKFNIEKEIKARRQTEIDNSAIGKEAQLSRVRQQLDQLRKELEGIR